VKMSVSFGVEFEFDYIKPNNHVEVFSGVPPRYRARNWDYQSDYTASTELRSPVFTSLEQFINECNQQFGVMVERDPELIPYMCNSRTRSLGQHMHIGKPNVMLSEETRIKIASSIIQFYPWLASIHAQPIPSTRGLTTSYARSMANYRSPICFYDHYAEISGSHLGTVELRIFDSNIPQASLVCAWLITELTKKALRNRLNENSINFDAYHEERQKALRYGLVALDVSGYLRRLKSVLGNIEIPDIPALKEALYLMARYRLNFYGVWKYADIKPYDYMKVQLSDISKFLENILRVDYAKHREKIATWIVEAQQIENLDQLIGLSVAVDSALAQQLYNVVESRIAEQPELARRIESNRSLGLGRSEVRTALERGYYRIVRINEVARLSVEDVANQISNWLTNHGEGLVNPLSAREIIESGARFYVFMAYEPVNWDYQLCGAIAVHRRNGEISSLVVDRRFRRLGIARILLNHAIEFLRAEGLPFATAHVRRENTACRCLMESLGFRVKGETERSLVYVKVLRGG